MSAVTFTDNAWCGRTWVCRDCGVTCSGANASVEQAAAEHVCRVIP